jgi:predicted O-methyltransferase YrrM
MSIPAGVISQASFLEPQWQSPSAWTEHASFAFWLVEALAPKSIVELGTHYGYSFFAFCQAVSALGVEAKCTAVDTWAGDEHAGFYENDVLKSVRGEALRYPFAALMQSTFDAALPSFEDGSIDLLHIDGRHFYEDVRHDWETWKPKLSERGVVLFHDTRVYKKEFGVHQLWAEISGQFPSFEFQHCYGLGVLGVGPHLPLAVQQLLGASPDQALAIRRAYQRLGSTLTHVPFRKKRRGLLGKWRSLASLRNYIPFGGTGQMARS